MESLPELGNEKLVPVGYEVEWEAIFAVPMVEEQKGKILCCDSGTGGNDADVRMKTVRYG